MHMLCSEYTLSLDGVFQGRKWAKYVGMSDALEPWGVMDKMDETHVENQNNTKVENRKLHS